MSTTGDKVDRTHCINTCNGCHEAEGIYFANYNDFMCPECASASDLADEAYQHAISLLEPALAPVMRAWLQHWQARGLGAWDAGGIFDCAIAAVLSRAEKQDQE
jgi:hypothetical protein